MLGRRQIREKVIQSVYSYYQNPMPYQSLERNMFSTIEKIYDLYILELNFLIALKELAERQVQVNENKNFKNFTQDPHLKFVKNRIIHQIEHNSQRLVFMSKSANNHLNWDLYDELLLKTFNRIIEGKRYKDYIFSQEDSFEDDQKFIGRLFLRYVAENADFQDYVEEMEMAWADDLHIANSMVQKTIGFMKEDDPSHTLLKVMKDTEDKNFALKLLNFVLNNREQTEKKMQERLENWDLERVSLMDRVILLTAMTEVDFFPHIHGKIIMNEYIEIAKAFSTGKSNIFINGILDKYLKDINRN